MRGSRTLEHSTRRSLRLDGSDRPPDGRSAVSRTPAIPASLAAARALPRAGVWRNVGPTLGVLPAMREGENTPLVPVRTMPAQGSATYRPLPCHSGRGASMNATDKFYARDAHVDAAAVAPLPNSRKIHVEGSRPDIRVPMREIAQGDTDASFGAEKNAPIVVYDTSGPYTDPDASIDIRKGLPALRAPWIAERGDTVELEALSSAYGRVAARRRRARRNALRPPPQAAPGRSRQRTWRQRLANALRAPRHRHARDGIRRDPRESEARGDAGSAARARHAAASGPELRRGDPRCDDARVRARARSPAGARSSRPTSITPKASR